MQVSMYQIFATVLWMFCCAKQSEILQQWPAQRGRRQDTAVMAEPRALSAAVFVFG